KDCEPRGCFSRHRRLSYIASVVAVVSVFGPSCGRRRRRSRDPFQSFAPEGFALRQVLHAHPRHEVLVRSRRGQRKISTQMKRVIERKHFIEHKTYRPSIEQQVVIAPHQLMMFLAKSDKKDTHQRSSRQIEAAIAVGLEKTHQTLLLLVLVDVAPVL